VGSLPQELSFLQLTGEPVMVQRKKKPSGAQQKRLRKQKDAPYNSDLLRFLHPRGGFHSTLVRNTRGFTGGWTMGPSAAWFYEGQLCLHRNCKLDPTVRYFSILSLLRLPPDRLASVAMDWVPGGKRRRGRPSKTWRPTLQEDLQVMKVSWSDVRRAASDRSPWKNFVAQYSSRSGKIYV